MSVRIKTLVAALCGKAPGAASFASDDVSCRSQRDAWLGADRRLIYQKADAPPG